MTVKPAPDADDPIAKAFAAHAVKTDAFIKTMLCMAYKEGFHDAEQQIKEAMSQVDLNADRGWRHSISASYGEPEAPAAVDPQASSDTDPTPRDAKS